MSEYGCREFRETQFTPICDYKPLTGTEPLAMEIPMPVFPASIPPDDCVCFTFESEHREVDVITVTKDVKPSCYVEIEQAGDDCCAGKYKVTPHMEVPACLYPDTGWQQADTTGAHLGNFGLQYRTVNCGLEMKVVGSIPEPPCVPTPDPDTFNLPIVYEDASGETQEENITFTIKFPKDKDHPCRWCIDDPDPLDFRKMNIGKYNNNGAVFSPTAGGSGEGGLFIDGTIDDDIAKTYYGGGLGNQISETTKAILESKYRRGWRMRNDAIGIHGNLPVPFGSGGIKHQFVSLDDEIQTWHSSTKTTDSKGNVSYNEGTGYLNIVMPSGFQWAFRHYDTGNPTDETVGIGVALTTFTITPDGIVGKAEENEELMLLSPAPVYRTDSNGGYLNNASGLTAIPETEDTEKIKYSGGLSVLFGGGLCIQKMTKQNNKPAYLYPTVDTNKNLAHVDGELRVLYGPGMRMCKKADGLVSYETTSTEIPGALSIDSGRGLHLTECTNAVFNKKLEVFSEEAVLCFVGESSGSSVTGAKLCINDKKAAGALSGATMNNWPGDDAQHGDVTWDKTSEKELLLRVVSRVDTNNDGTVSAVRYTYLRFACHSGKLVCMGYKPYDLSVEAESDGRAIPSDSYPGERYVTQSIDECGGKDPKTTV